MRFTLNQLWHLGLTAAVIGLTIVTAAPLVWTETHFPKWFSFVFPLAAFSFCFLLALNAAFLQKPFLLRKVELNWKSGNLIAWGLIWISFFAVASLHKFYLFTPSRIIHDLLVDDGAFLLSFNSVLNILGLTIVPFLYLVRRRIDPTAALLALASVLLIPNDDCRNDFNRVWLEYGSWSPMMFVPNVAVILFSAPMIQHRMNWFSLVLVCITIVATTLLGLGHITKFIW